MQPVHLRMGNRQLALIFAVGTAVITLGLAAVRMMLGLSPAAGIIGTLIVYAASSLMLVLIAKKKWELDYKNAFIMLFSSSFVCALIYAFGYKYVQNAFPEMQGEDDHYAFAALLIVNLIPRAVLDAIAAVFYKR